MSKRIAIPASMISAFAFITICLLPAAIAAQIQSPANQAVGHTLSLAVALQKGPAPVAGAPLTGVVGTLAKPGGGLVAASAISDSKGKLAFPVLARGSYALTLTMVPLKKPTGPSKSGAATNEKGPAAEEVKAAVVTIYGANGRREVGWDFEKAESFNLAPDSTARVIRGPLTCESDGKTPITLDLAGTKTAIVKSKSNITNN